MRNSKFNDYLDEISTNGELKTLLSTLDSSSRKDKLEELYPNIEVTGHFFRKVNEILKKTVTPQTTDSSINTPNTKKTTKDKSEENNQFKTTKDVIAPLLRPNDNLTNKEICISRESITGSDELKETNTVIVSQAEIAKLEDAKSKFNTLLNENESFKKQNSTLILENSNLKTKLKSLNISYSEKIYKIMEMLASYPHSHFKSKDIDIRLLSDLIATFAAAKIVDTTDLSKKLTDVATYCIEFALCESIYLHSVPPSPNNEESISN